MDALGFVWRAPRRHPMLAATLFLVVSSGLIVASGAYKGNEGHGSQPVLFAGAVLVALIVVLVGTATLDWHSGLLLEEWQLRRHLKINILGELDADLMRRLRAETPPHDAEGQSTGSVAPHQALSRSPLVPATVQAPTGMATAEQVDSFRELRTRLLSAAADLNFMPFTTLVVPLASGSGASFVARNLAASFAYQQGASALLIDCNLSHPSQHLALCTSDEGGLSDFIEQPDAYFAPKPTAIPGLFLIPAGRSRWQFREYFSSSRMHDLVHGVRDSGRFVFLDGPPAKGSPDARILSDLADLVILVVGSGKSTSEEIAQAVATFDPAKFAGVVFDERA